LNKALAVSLDLLAGHTGLLSIAQAAFYGLGAYTSALMSTHLGAPFLAGLCVSMVIAAVVSFVVSLPSLRLYEDYFTIATFGFQMFLLSIINNWIDLTQGPLGIRDIPQPVIFGWPVQSHIEFLILASILTAIAYFVVIRLSASPFGRVLRAIREDEVFAQAMGKDTLRFKVTAFAASAGSLYAHYITYIDPTSFTVMESILILSMVIIGGAGSQWGPLIGAIVLVTLPEALQFLGLSSSFAANLRQIIYGILLVVLMILRPRGLVGLSSQ
jgi:branched-chain amino acid transport system permease protein